MHSYYEILISFLSTSPDSSLLLHPMDLLPTFLDLSRERGIRLLC